MKDWKDTGLADDKSEDKLSPIERAEDPLDVEKNEVNGDAGAQIEKVKSTSKNSEIDPFGIPPDGGLNAWLKVLGCFLIYSNIWYAMRWIFDSTFRISMY